MNSKGKQIPNKSKGLIGQLKEFIPESKAYLILYDLGLYRNDLSFKEFCKQSIPKVALETIETYRDGEDYQKGMKYILKIQHQKKMNELYNIYYEKAKEDVQSAKFFIDFSSQYFKDDEENLLEQLANNLDIGDDETEK